MTYETRVLREQDECLRLKRNGVTTLEIARTLGLTRHQALRRLKGAEKREKLDPALAGRLARKGIVDLAGLHSGWLLEKDKDGTGSSLYFFLGPDEEKVSFADAMVEVLGEIPRLPPLAVNRDLTGRADYANWIALADLHLGAHYGDVRVEEDFNRTIDDLVARMPAASHAVLFELGDLLDANDHKGVTPHSGNPCDVIRENHLENTLTAVRLIRRALYRLLETHDTVEAHFIKGNHDTTAYIAVMLALAEHFADNPRVYIPVISDEYRVVSWGACAAFPHHGDTLKWDQLKDVWAELYPDAWAAAKAHRHIMTAHFHHDRKKELVGCTAEHFRTLQRPNGWAKAKGLLSRGALTAMTVHRQNGEVSRTISNIHTTH